MNEFMDKALKEAKIGVDNGDGGPFGALIVLNGQIIAQAHNEVLKTNDPTNHAEILAIKRACEVLKNKDLSKCILYTSCEPCPMCLSACIWANIKKIYYGCSRIDAKKIGFKDDDIYEFIKGNNKLIDLEKLDNTEALKQMREYKGKIY